ncbi:MAG: phosphotransferase [Bacteroidetes bacterium]|jgi:aminoglycoside phosphotransferase (APT) family kinase protein|nr:phosphotransferase [Bacteroidota bacterium]
MDQKIIADILRNEQLIFGEELEFKPLKGGVSSDIVLVSDGNNSVVVKQALPKLNVEDDWYADISRNENEQRFIRFLTDIKPEATPKLLYSNSEHSFFVMEFLDEGFLNWKKQMLNGVFDTQIAEKAAVLLATIHQESWKDDHLKQEFNKGNNFFELRTEPYLVTTGERHPELRELFFDEVERLKNYQEAIVHGDFSPKNIMVNNDRVVFLDHEVAWFGDPAFDLAFFMNHLYLKMLYHFKKTGEILDLTTIAWATYFNQIGDEILQQMEKRSIRLLLMMMLARIDGKSPVEYLEIDQQEFVRSFVKKHLLAGRFSQGVINQNWKEELKQTFSED